MSNNLNNIFQTHRKFLWILLIGLIHGTIYTFLVPPWQHYDEPGHFEYGWLIANQNKIPSKGAYDQAMRRELAASMIKHDFFGENLPKPNLLSDSDPIWIGYSQTGDSPLYYRLVAIPLSLIASRDISLQMYVSRIFSLTLYLVTILAAYGIACNLTDENHPLRWMLPLTLALLPGFTDLMTAINNDVGAVAAFSLFLWFSIRIIRYGFLWRHFFGMILTALLCLLTKNTVAVAIPLGVIALLFGLLRGKYQKYAWGILMITAICAIPIIFNWRDAAHWQHITSPADSTRVEHPVAPIGKHVLRLHLSSKNSKSILTQSISHENILELIRGRKTTVGAWIWVDDGQANGRIALYDENEETIGTYKFDLSGKPQFFSFLSKIPKDIQNIHITLWANNQSGSYPISVYYDGVILIPGDHTDVEIPECLDPECNRVVWDGITFGNIIRNSSAEKAWPSIHHQISKYVSKVLPTGQPSIILSALLNWPISFRYFQATIDTFLQTFWAKFGWGHVPLLGYKPYRILAILTAIAIIGTFVRVVRLRKKMPWAIIFFFTITLFLIWGGAFMRGLFFTRLLSTSSYIPVARYAYPAIIPTALILNLGWLEISDQAKTWFQIPKNYLYGLYIAFFISLDTLSIISIYYFYYLS